MTPREFFPTTPNEIFDSWLSPIINGKGWPFTSLEDDLQKTEWKYVLGLDNTLKGWHSCIWESINIDLNTAKWQWLTLSVVRDIIINCTKGVPTSTANVVNTKERFRACASFYKENGTVPSPIIVSRVGNGFEMIDGNHRLAAIVHVGIAPNLVIPAWVAELTT